MSRFRDRAFQLDSLTLGNYAWRKMSPQLQFHNRAHLRTASLTVIEIVLVGRENYTYVISRLGSIKRESRDKMKEIKNLIRTSHPGPL